MMSSMTLLRTSVEKKKMTAVTSMAPAKAATNTATKPDTLTEPAEKLPPRNSMTRATPRPAPLLMPKMPGPANGLRKAVCSMSPLTASAPPASVAVSVCGSRDCRMMKRHEGLTSASASKRMRSTSSAGIDTEPTKMLNAKSTAMSRPRAMQMMTPLLCFMHFPEIT